MVTPPSASTPEPPYHAVIFTSTRTPGDDGYAQVAERMVALASEMPGFLGVESARSPDGFGITVSYWTNEAAIAKWREHAEHLRAQEHGKQRWYESYTVRVAKVERAYGKPSIAAGGSGSEPAPSRPPDNESLRHRATSSEGPSGGGEHSA